MGKIHIKKISEIDLKKLIRFYQKTFKYEKSVVDDYKWRYRSNFNEYEPLVLMINDQICGHAGLIPIKIKINHKQENAIWFTDFYINPEHRHKGYGKLLTEEWMKICPIQITFCNDQSLKIFKKMNWSFNNKITKKIKFNNYLKLIPIFRKFNLPDFNLTEINNLQHIELNNTNLDKIINLYNRQSSSKSLRILRDESWFRWRLIDCPYRNKIHIFQFKGFFFITHIKFKNNFKILNIIYSSTLITSEIKNIFSEFSKKNSIDYISYLTTEKKISNNILPWNRKINFAYYAKDDAISNALGEHFYDVHLIDSDVDYL